MYASSVVPDHMKQDPVLWGKVTTLQRNQSELSHAKLHWLESHSSAVAGEGMGGSLFWKDLISLAHSVGFSTPRLVSASHIEVHNIQLKEKAGSNRKL